MGQHNNIAFECPPTTQYIPHALTKYTPNPHQLHHSNTLPPPPLFPHPAFPTSIPRLLPLELLQPLARLPMMPNALQPATATPRAIASLRLGQGLLAVVHLLQDMQLHQQAAEVRIAHLAPEAELQTEGHAADRRGERRDQELDLGVLGAHQRRQGCFQRAGAGARGDVGVGRLPEQRAPVPLEAREVLREGVLAGVGVAQGGERAERAHQRGSVAVVEARHERRPHGGGRVVRVQHRVGRGVDVPEEEVLGFQRAPVPGFLLGCARRGWRARGTREGAGDDAPQVETLQVVGDQGFPAVEVALGVQTVDAGVVDAVDVAGGV